MMPATVDDYVGRVNRSLVGMDRSVRDDVVNELRANLRESVRANGGNVTAAIGEMGPPAEVARRYRQVYGYGRVYQVAFVAGASLLGLLSLPVVVPNPGAGSLLGPAIVLAILIAFLLWISVAAGAAAGLAAGLGAASARIVGFAMLALSGQTFDSAGLVLLIAVSGLLPLLGWLPGRAKRAWTKPGADL